MISLAEARVAKSTGDCLSVVTDIFGFIQTFVIKILSSCSWLTFQASLYLSEEVQMSGVLISFKLITKLSKIQISRAPDHTSAKVTKMHWTLRDAGWIARR